MSYKKFCEILASVETYIIKSSHHGSEVMKPTSIHEDKVQALTSLRGLKIRCCHELWYRSKMWLGSLTAVAVV